MDMQKESSFPFVEIIIVTWNKKDDVLALLAQLRDIDYAAERLHVIVVDNHSSDSTCTEINKQFGFVHLIENSENLGGAGGFNTGMRWVLRNNPDADFMWLLDNDVQLERDALNHLVAAMQANPGAAVCGSRIMNRDDPSEVIEAGAYIDYRKGDILSNSDIPTSPGQIFDVDYVAACSLLARVSAVKEQGIWHDDLFIYWDDMEWGARFRKNGYRVLAVGDSVVYHPSWRTRTFDHSAVWRSYYRTRNALWFFCRYTGGIRRVRLLARIAMRASVLSMISALQANTPLSRAYLDGISDFLTDGFGKKPFVFPPADLDAYVIRHRIRHLCVFITHRDQDAPAEAFIRRLKKQHPQLVIHVVAPVERKPETDNYRTEWERVHFYEPGKTVAGAVREKVKVLRFLMTVNWTCLVSSYGSPKLGTLFFRDVVRVDYKHGHTFMISRIDPGRVIRLPVAAAGVCLSILKRGCFSTGSRQ